MIRFQNPEWLLLLLAIPYLIFRYVTQDRQKAGRIRFSGIGAFKRMGPSLSLTLRHCLIVFRCLGLVFLVVAMARPQSGREGREILSQGIDIVLALDVSSSMEAKDLANQRKTRLEVSKDVVSEFVSQRANDRLSLVVFAGESYTQCPLTTDYDVFQGFLNGVEIADGEWDGTAIGLGIATAVNRLRESEAQSKVIILLTDGKNNRGEIDPTTAARAAKAVGVRIYTIGAGSDGTIMQEQSTIFGKRFVPVKVEIDEETLKQVADITGGRYFRATSAEKLEAIYQEIGEMEKTEIKMREYVDYRDLFENFLWAAMALFLLELTLANTRFRRLP
ncbi:MAG: VWA domain-containing protein [bacterium]|nr:VWA domain-containing protein [bacterium]